MPFFVDEKYISATEQKLGLQFPPTFREAMKQNNGGEVETDKDTWQLHPFLDTSDRNRLKRTSNCIVRETMNAREWESFPPDAVVIGDNGLIFLPGDDPSVLSNVVFWWDHETGEICKVADDFGDLGQ